MSDYLTEYKRWLELGSAQERSELAGLDQSEIKRTLLYRAGIRHSRYARNNTHRNKRHERTHRSPRYSRPGRIY